jgi:hypothetical protein
MKIIITDLTGVVAALTLGDDSAGNYIVDPPPVPIESRVVQNEPLAFGSRQFSYGRGNALTRFSWSVEWLFATNSAAAQFAWAHSSSVAWNVSIAIEGPPVWATFSSACMSEVAIVEQCGCAVKARYTADGAVPGPIPIPPS